MKRFVLPVLALVLVLLFPRGGESRQREVGRLLGADLSGAEVLEDYDSHGGFHGDGYTCVVLQVPEDSELLPAGREDLPLPRELEAAVYGVTHLEGDAVASWGPLRDDAAPEIPRMERGWYWFYDFHDQSTDPHDSGPLWERASFNFALVLCDADQSRLYYIRLDT